MDGESMANSLGLVVTLGEVPTDVVYSDGQWSLGLGLRHELRRKRSAARVFRGNRYGVAGDSEH